MTGGAGHVIGVVQAALPVFDISLMTAKADSIAFFSGNIGIFAKSNKSRCVDFSRHIKMMAAWAMTDFAAIITGSRCSRVRLLPVLVIGQIVQMVFMTFHADFTAEIGGFFYSRLFRRARCVIFAAFICCA